MRIKEHKLKSFAAFISLVIVFLIPVSSFSQLQLVRYDSIPVTKTGDTLNLAWAGGFNSPQFSQIDLNGDGIKDLFAFERNFYGIVKSFLNKGTPAEIDYVYAPCYQHAFPKMRNWALLRDYNCDGKEDIFTNVPFGMAVYRNDYTPESGLKFTLVNSLLQTSTPEGTESLYVSPPDIPSISDIDNDGDLDILTFDIIGKYVEYHKSQSFENNGNCDQLEYELKNRCWGYFSENETNNGITLYDTCADNVTDPEKAGRHAGSSLLALDLTGNGVKDLLLGDIAHDNIVQLTNTGTVTGSSMQQVDEAFPSNSQPVDLTTFPAAFYLDVNNDEKKDLIITPNNPNTSENSDDIWHYKNTGTNEIPVFTFQSNHFLQGKMIDVGEGAKPVFFDYDSDGLEDIVIGNFGYFVEAGDYESKLALYRNSGSATSPAFEFVTDDYSGLSSLNLKGVYPAFGDLDGDGDKDLLTGDEEGNIHLFINTASQGEPANFVLSQPNYKNIDAGQTAMPQLVDVNRDGKPDLLIGERSGTIKYYENTGTSEEADFSSIPTIDQFGGIDVMPECCTGYAAPYLTEDSTGSHILYVGSERGNLYLFNNIDGNLYGDFSVVDSLFLYGLNVNVDGTDINGDGKEELVYGEYTGGIAILQNGTPSFLGVEVNKIELLQVELFPNPASSILNIRIRNTHQTSTYKVECIDLFGNVIKTGLISNQTGDARIDLSEIKRGIYFVRISDNYGLVTKKLVVN